MPAGAALSFAPLPPPDQEDVERIAERIAVRHDEADDREALERLLRYCGSQSRLTTMALTWDSRSNVTLDSGTCR